MTVTPAQAQKILTGSYTFSQLGFSMLITRLKRNYAQNSSKVALQECVEEINMFLRKYSALMAADFAIISKL